MLEYKRERTEFSDTNHDLAREITEAINAFINEEKGDEFKESLDVGIAISRMLMGATDKNAAIAELVNTMILVGLNAGKARLETPVA